MQLGTNVVGTALLTSLLLPLVAASTQGRVVVLSSNAVSFVGGSKGKPWPRLADVGGERETASGMSLYADSKLLNALWAEALQARLRASASAAHVVVVSVHPGAVKTDILNKVDTKAVRARAGAGGRMGAAVRARMLRAAARFFARFAQARRSDLFALRLCPPIHRSQSCFAAVLVALAPRLVAVPVERGALSPLFCASSPDVEPGRMFSDGPRIRLFPLAGVAQYTPANVQAAFDAIDAAIRAKGGAAFALP